MVQEEVIFNGLNTKLKDYFQLIKFRLTFTVVLSAALGYLIAVNGEFTALIAGEDAILNDDGLATYKFILKEFIALIVGGFLVVAGSNGLNQVIERNKDILMERTQDRPVATRRLSVLEASLFSVITGLLGVAILWYFNNSLTAFLGFLSLVSYAFFYTPLKGITPIAVLVGAFPGAIPPLLGWIAATADYSLGGGILYAIQFFWQFPHFWAIAWVLHEDYQKAGYLLLPSRAGKTKGSGMQTVIYTIMAFALSLTPVYLEMTSLWSLTLLLPMNIYFLMASIKLYKTLEESDAKKLMYASFLYLPIVLLAILIF